MNTITFPHAANERRTRGRPAYYLAQLAEAEVSRNEVGVTYNRDVPPFAPAPRPEGPTPAPRPANAPRGNVVAPRAVVRPLDWSSRGPALWAELHTRPRESSGDDTAWLEAFARRVPCGECRRHLLAFIRDTPPDYSSPVGYFAWSVSLHNSVNRKLGKPEMPLDEAQRFWGF